MRKLMELYPVAPCTEEEYNECCGRFGHRKESCSFTVFASDHSLDVSSSYPQHQPPIWTSVNTPVTNSDDTFGPWMIVSWKSNKSRPFQRSDTRNDARQAAVSNGRMTKASHAGRQSRFSPIEDLETEENLTADEGKQAANRGLDMGMVRREERRSDKPISVKSVAQEKKKSPAGNQNFGVTQKQKITYRPKENKGETGSKESKSESSPNGPGRIGPHEFLGASSLEDKGDLQKNGLNKEGGPMGGGNTGGQYDMECVDFIEEHHALNQVPETNTQLVLHKDHKKGKKTKGPRTHNLVHGCLDQKINQSLDIQSENPDNPNEQFHDLPVEQNQHLPHFNNPRPPDNWDPNEDVAPDFMEANGSFVAETQFDQQRGEEVGRSSNGLLCVSCNTKDCLWLWNPSIRVVRQVPKSLNYAYEGFSVGFGFSPIINDYKIVKFFLPLVVQAEVYSLRTGLWRKVEVGNLKGIHEFRCKAFPCNGAVFWIGRKEDVRGTSKSWQDSKSWLDLIVSFDIATEVFTLIPFLPMAPYYCYDTLASYENKLAIFFGRATENCESYVIDLWVLEECADPSRERWSWAKIYTSESTTRSKPLYHRA
ncbi:hypothetical protein K1719_033365 [Acacia pycnantha]|nr:hypothetical protein K1719_033365 [Acacia pycnantha]